MRSVRDLEIHGRKVLLRVDFNVPLDDGTVVDDTRIRAALPTIRYLIERQAMVIACSHLGRPKGQVVPTLSLAPAGARLAELLELEVGFADDCVGPAAQQAVARLQPSQVLLLENTRFHAGEKENDPDFARQLASLAEVYVNDAFGTAHRAHASTEGVVHYLTGAAGLLIEREVRFLDEALIDPPRPFIALLGGAKIADKIGVIGSFLARVDLILIGGGMANTFLAAGDLDLGDSLVESDSLDTARELLAQADGKIRLPTDAVVANAISAEADRQILRVEQVRAGWTVLDIGPDTIADFTAEVMQAKTVVWNGPMGVFELEPFAAGTRQLAEAVGRSEAMSIVGGGDSVAAIVAAGLADQFTHLSTGGGASLAMLEGKLLPALAVL